MMTGYPNCIQIEMLEIPPDWNAVPDLIMEDDEGTMITETDTKRKRDKVA